MFETIAQANRISVKQEQKAGLSLPYIQLERANEKTPTAPSDGRAVMVAAPTPDIGDGAGIKSKG